MAVYWREPPFTISMLLGMRNSAKVKEKVKVTLSAVTVKDAESSPAGAYTVTVSPEMPTQSGVSDVDENEREVAPGRTSSNT